MNAELKEQVWHVLEVQLNDTQKAQFLQANGSYIKADKREKEQHNAQEEFCVEYMALGTKKEKQQARVFKPEYNQSIEE